MLVEPAHRLERTAVAVVVAISRSRSGEANRLEG